HPAEDLAPYSHSPGLPVGHHASRSRHYVDSYTAQDLRNSLTPAIHSASRLGYALQRGQHLLAFWTIAQVNPDAPPRSISNKFVVIDKGFILQDARDLQFQSGHWHVDLLMLGPKRIPYSREHVCNRICHSSLLNLIIRRLPARLGNSGDVPL